MTPYLAHGGWELNSLDAGLGAKHALEDAQLRCKDADLGGCKQGGHTLRHSIHTYIVVRVSWTGLDWTGLDWTGQDWCARVDCLSLQACLQVGAESGPE